MHSVGLENPASFLMWKCQPVCSLLESAAAPRLRCAFEWCRYGRPWAKPTYLAGSAPWLLKLGRHCRRDHEHVRLEGSVQQGGRWVDRSALAAEYSAPFARRVLQLASAGEDE